MVNGINNRGYYPNLGHSWTYPLAQYTPRDSKRENHPMAKKHVCCKLIIPGIGNKNP